MARTRELATAMKEKDAKAAVLRIRSENIKRSGQALNALAELTEDEAALLAPSPEVRFTATKARRGPDSHGKTLYVFTITPHGLEHHEVTGVFYVLFVGSALEERLDSRHSFSSMAACGPVQS
jgi:hypothetical protein